MHRDKLRALMFGIKAGVPSIELDGETVLALMDAPLELEEALRRWLWSRQEFVREDSPHYALRFDSRERMAIPWGVWEEFLSWMQQALLQALDQQDPHDKADISAAGLEFGARHPHLHLEKHRRSLALHCLIGEKIRRDPSLLEQARATMDRWMAAKRSDRPQPYYITEWRAVIDQGIDATLALMTDPGDRATQLRQSSPFSNTLSKNERVAFLAEWRTSTPRPGQIQARVVYDPGSAMLVATIFATGATLGAKEPRDLAELLFAAGVRHGRVSMPDEREGDIAPAAGDKIVLNHRLNELGQTAQRQANYMR
jgi:hypothetical protein